MPASASCSLRVSPRSPSSPSRFSRASQSLRAGNSPPARAPPLATLIAPLAIVAWYQSGPAKHGWAKRAGTPTTLLAARKQTARQIVQPVRNSFSAALNGHITESTDANGLVDVVIAGALNRGRIGAVRIDLRGESFQGGVSMTASGVSYVPAGTRTVYNGSVTTLDGQTVVAQVAVGIDAAATAVQPQHRRGLGHRQRPRPRYPGSERMRNGRLLASLRTDGQPVFLTEHVARYGPLNLDTDLIATTIASGLRGRGGGAFPTGEKLRAVAGQRGRPIVVLNGAEGEPASRKDKALLRSVPHLALDGAAAAAAALGAARWSSRSVVRHAASGRSSRRR